MSYTQLHASNLSRKRVSMRYMRSRNAAADPRSAALQPGAAPHAGIIASRSFARFAGTSGLGGASGAGG
eukprot:4583335-Pyramimonas_sp.AAC.1